MLFCPCLGHAWAKYLPATAGLNAVNLLGRCRDVAIDYYCRPSMKIVLHGEPPALPMSSWDLCIWLRGEPISLFVLHAPRIRVSSRIERLKACQLPALTLWLGRTGRRSPTNGNSTSRHDVIPTFCSPPNTLPHYSTHCSTVTMAGQARLLGRNFPS